jgi:hypothetical protein
LNIRLKSIKPCTWTRGSHIEYQIKIIKSCTLTWGGHVEYQIKIIKPCTLTWGGNVEYQIKIIKQYTLTRGDHTEYQIKTRKNCFRYLKLMSPLKNNYLTLRSKVKVPQRSLWYATHRLMVKHPHTKYNWPISKDKNIMARTRKYYIKNNYLTLRPKVKVPRRSLRYATHRLMVMHPHTK